MNLKLTLRQKRRQSPESGFTLMELIVVIAILGLLSAIAVPRVIGYLDNAKIGAAKSSIDGLSSALDLYRIDVGRFPTTKEGLDALLAMPAAATGWNGPYIRKKAELTDPWGHAYQYASPGQHGLFDLFSYGPNSKGPTDLSNALTSW